MRPEQSGGVLRLAVVVAVFLAAGFAVGTPPPAPAFRAAVTAAAQDASAVEASLGLDRSTRRLIQRFKATPTIVRCTRPLRGLCSQYLLSS